MKLKKALSYILAFAMIMTCISFTPVTPRVKAGSEPDYLTFTSDEAFAVMLTQGRSAPDFTLEYSTDKAKWTSWSVERNTSGNTVYTADAALNSEGEYVIYFRGKNNTKFATSDSILDKSYFSFVRKGEGEGVIEIKAAGDIMTILDYENPDTVEMENYAFCGMFKDCTSLVEAPKLSAGTLKKGCYQEMFSGCTSLKKAPELKAKTLAQYCYNKMFSGCTALKEACELPAPTLEYGCYQAMFKDCISLTKAPELRAGTLATSCYASMFYGCKHLKITKLEDSTGAKWIIPASTATTAAVSMVYNTASTGTVEVSSSNINYYKVEGTQNFSYASSENSINATCGCSKCNSTDKNKLKVSITLNAPDMDYTGNAYDKAAIEDKDVWEAVGLETPKIKYYKAGEENELAGAPTAAGTYKAEITYVYGSGEDDKVTVSDDFEIKKLDNTISDFTCDDITSDNTPNPLATAVSGRLTYTYSDSEDGTYKEDWNEVFTEPGTYYVKATSEETVNYKSKSETISFNVLSACNYEKECTIENGIFNLILGGNVYGPVKLTKSGEGWAIYSVDLQKYIYWDGSNVTYSDTAYVWNYNNGFYITKTTTEKRWWRSITTKKSYYLSYDGNNLSVASKAVNATLTQSKQDKGHTCLCRDNGDGTHTLYCVNCGEVIQTSDCVYGENGLCMFCNHLDPSCVSFDVAVSVSSKTTKACGWMRFFSKSSKTTYIASITATCTGDDLKSVEYSSDNVDYKKGMTYSNSSEITTLYIRVTAANGASKTYLYQDGIVTPVGQPE